MMLTEADGKRLLAAHGIAVPHSVLVDDKTPWRPSMEKGALRVVKAQVPVGGRGKAGGVVLCRSDEDVSNALKRILGSSIKGHVVRSCLVEDGVAGRETYLSVMVDADAGGVRLTFVAGGGVDVEAAAHSGAARSIVCEANAGAAIAALDELLAGESEEDRIAVERLALKLVEMFFDERLILAEINPLFLSKAGAIAGDAKVVIDTNALEQRESLRTLVERSPQTYPEAWRKLREGFDLVELDPEGRIGLVTTGAGLSMMLVDELVARGGRPLNFCDIRTGQLRGDPARLIWILEWLAAKPHLRVVFINIFAGITDLTEFAGLLVEALHRVPDLRAALVIRLVGNGETEARSLLAREMPDVSVFVDLEPAMDRAIEAAR